MLCVPCKMQDHVAVKFCVCQYEKAKKLIQCHAQSVFHTQVEGLCRPNSLISSGLFFLPSHIFNFGYFEFVLLKTDQSFSLNPKFSMFTTFTMMVLWRPYDSVQKSLKHGIGQVFFSCNS